MNSTRLGPPRTDLLPPDAAPRTNSAPSSAAAPSPDHAPLRSSGAAAQSSGYAGPDSRWSEDGLLVRAAHINAFEFDEPSGSPHGEQVLHPSPSSGAGSSGSAFNFTELNVALLSRLDRIPQIRLAAHRASELDHMVAIALHDEMQVSATAEARQRIVSFANRDAVATERLVLLVDQINAAESTHDLDAIAATLRALRRVLQPGQAVLQAVQTQHHLDARRAELDMAGAPLQRQGARTDRMKDFAELMDNPASKVKVRDLPIAAALKEKHGEEIAEASYLIPKDPSAPVFRLGKTVDNGGFSKIRDFVDENGNYGKMRVLHMHEQLSAQPKIVVQTTPPHSFLSERRASSKAGSPVAFDKAFSVVSDHPKPVLKLYVPLPALGIESGFFDGGDESLTERHPPRKVASAMRTYLASINDRLLALHSNDAQGEGMVHSDIKPANVLISAQGQVNLIDFGLARPTRTLPNGGLAGTHGFFAPEYLALRSKQASPTFYPLSDKLDIWSLAATTLLTFFGQQSAGLPLHDPSRQAGTNDNLYYGVLQEIWTRDRYGQEQPFNLMEEYGRLRPPKSDCAPELAFVDDFYTKLDTLRQKFEDTDPDLSRLFFQHVYRFDANERYSSAELAEALIQLPFLHGSADRDREVGRQLFVDAFPPAHALFEASRTYKFGPSGGPSKKQLAALPTQPNADVAA